jgi:hypothetical protein
MTRACTRRTPWPRSKPPLKKRARAESLDVNPIDSAWEDRPAPPRAKVNPHPLELAGDTHADKRRRIGGDVEATARTRR